MIVLLSTAESISLCGSDVDGLDLEKVGSILEYLYLYSHMCMYIQEHAGRLVITNLYLRALFFSVAKMTFSELGFTIVR